LTSDRERLKCGSAATGIVEPANKTHDMKYRVWLRETAYYVVRVEAETEEAAVDTAEHSALPKPYDYSPVVATKAELVPTPTTSRYKPGPRRRW
jgi:hypothetical protein